MMYKKGLLIGSGLCLTGIIFGAFGAHLIENTFGEKSSDIFNTAAEYQMYHGLAILVTVILFRFSPHPSFIKAVYIFLTGVIFFSGSLYVLAIKSVIGTWTSIIGPITPIGGLLLICAWCFFIHGITQMEKPALPKD